eukprot:SAG11_NODE_163_length_13928_cov_29.869188_14_plen_55_part_00
MGRPGGQGRCATKRSEQKEGVAAAAGQGEAHTNLEPTNGPERADHSLRPSNTVA